MNSVTVNIRVYVHVWVSAFTLWAGICVGRSCGWSDPQRWGVEIRMCEQLMLQKQPGWEEGAVCISVSQTWSLWLPARSLEA